MVDFWFLGQACFRIKGKNATIVFDPYGAQIGLGPLKTSADIVCVSHAHHDHNNVAAVSGEDEDKTPFLIAGPGEYEISGVNIVGIASFHDDKNGEERGVNTIYHATLDDVNIVHLGDLGQRKLTQDQVSELSTCDVMLIPVGGVFTISAKDAGDVIAQIEPKIIIPMHYMLPGLKFNLDPVSKFLSAMGKEKLEAVSKFSVSRDRLPEEPEVVLMQKQ